MRQANIETKSFRTKMAAGYVLIVLLVGGIVHTWLGGWHQRTNSQACARDSMEKHAGRAEADRNYVNWRVATAVKHGFRAKAQYS